jgi:hypothetical protein
LPWALPKEEEAEEEAVGLLPWAFLVFFRVFSRFSRLKTVTDTICVHLSRAEKT